MPPKYKMLRAKKMYTSEQKSEGQKMAEVQFRDTDVRRVAWAIYRHMTTRPTDPFRGITEMWSVMRFAIWAYPILVYHGYIGLTEE